MPKDKDQKNIDEATDQGQQDANKNVYYKDESPTPEAGDQPTVKTEIGPEDVPPKGQ